MKKFWEWMKEKTYHGYFVVGINTIHDKMKSSCRPTKQMLIGYMLEYIKDHKIWKNQNVPFLEGDYAGVELRLSMIWICKQPYEELKDIISLINKE